MLRHGTQLAAQPAGYSRQSHPLYAVRAPRPHPRPQHEPAPAQFPPGASATPFTVSATRVRGLSLRSQLSHRGRADAVPGHGRNNRP
jgi:hypothetical protein